MSKTCYQIQQVNLLISRLERISADSIWARRASGIRGALLKWADVIVQAESKTGDFFEENNQESERLAYIIDLGYKILEQAAKERIR